MNAEYKQIYQEEPSGYLVLRVKNNILENYDGTIKICKPSDVPTNCLLIYITNYDHCDNEINTTFENNYYGCCFSNQKYFVNVKYKNKVCDYREYTQHFTGLPPISARSEEHEPNIFSIGEMRQNIINYGPYIIYHYGEPQDYNHLNEIFNFCDVPRYDSNPNRTHWFVMDIKGRNTKSAKLTTIEDK